MNFENNFENYSNYINDNNQMSDFSNKELYWPKEKFKSFHNNQKCSLNSSLRNNNIHLNKYNSFNNISIYESKKNSNNKFDKKYLNKSNHENENNMNNYDPNAKYADYPEKMLELINKIRENPSFYADVIEDSIQNIIENQDDDETKPKIIYKKKVKVALCRGEPAFREAAEKLRNMESLPPLEFKNDICAPLPDNEEEVKDPTYLKEQIKILRETTNIDVFFKDLIKLPEVSALLMIVDDGEKNPGRKRNALLNKDFKYIGINSKFIGKTFIAYFTFSR